MKDVTIYTDGACSGNPGKGGFGAVLIYGNKTLEIAGNKQVTTNNYMELMAVYQSLKQLKEQCCVNLYSDSAYVVNAFNQNWIQSWLENGWKNSQKQPVANKELWEMVLKLTSFHKVTFNKVKGHSGNKYNEICDSLATGSRQPQLLIDLENFNS